MKLSMAATRPAACSAMKVTAAPLAFGSMSPTVSPGAEIAASLRASTPTPMRNMRMVRGPPSGSSTTTPPEAVLSPASSKAAMQRAADVGRLEDEVGHHVDERGAGGAPAGPPARA